MASDHSIDELHRKSFEIGLKNRKEVVGEAYVTQALANGSSEFTYPGQQLVTRSVETNFLPADIGMLIALKSWPELAVHTRGAINNGLTELEIREAVLQAAVYCGVPAGVEAMKVTSKVIDEIVAGGEHVRELSEKSQAG
ncbi:4-carboxymuconolactone decarboxylase [Seiridium cupressi]